MFLGAAFAVLIGLALGLLGGGGSILTVPVFVYLLGYGVKEAVAMSLVVVGGVALFGVLGHWRAGNVNLRVAAIFGSIAMVGTYGGARMAVLLSDQVQIGLFAAVMLAAAFFMFRRGAASGPPSPSGRGVSDSVPVGFVALEGLAVGAITGLVGVGGGFLIVPALVLLARLPMKEAVGTSLLVIAMKSVTGFVGYLGQVEIAWAFLASFTAVAAAGIVLGSRIVRYVPPVALRRSFALFLVLVGSFILYQSLQPLGAVEAPGIAVPAATTPPDGTS